LIEADRLKSVFRSIPNDARHAPVDGFRRKGRQLTAVAPIALNPPITTCEQALMTAIRTPRFFRSMRHFFRGRF